ncbi:cytochrome c biogenesis CcdA family protein [Sporichthya brevicatena]|uniref:Cytochrome c biogenesis CcdA family protein n=1 Tax=Sporichthya brevicatena TaxID=171442 RepID=A0ABP3RTC0_9ACTN
MLDAPVGFAFSAGTVAAFNPCGFALLPAYLSVFLAGPGDAENADGARESGRPTLARAAVVAAVVASGFALVFGIAGLLISQTAVTVQRWTPWLSVGIGIALVPAGIAMMRGWTPKLRLPAVRGVRADGGIPAMFAFGVSYAVVSLSCTIPAFLVSVVGTFSDDDLAGGLVVFGAYTAGMASVLVVLTVVVALARQTLLARIRRVLPYVNLAAGTLAVLAGAYVAYYGWYEIRIERGADPPEGPITLVGDWSGSVTTWVSEAGNAAVLVGAGVALVAVVAVAVRSRRAVEGSRQ